MSRGKSRKKAKSNLDDFDTARISADLDAVEMENLELDPHAIRNAKISSQRNQQNFTKIDETQPNEDSETAYDFKPRAVNVVGFSPQRSELLHAAVRNKQEGASNPAVKFVTPKIDDVKNFVNEKTAWPVGPSTSLEKPKGLKVRTKGAGSLGYRLGGSQNSAKASIDGFGITKKSEDKSKDRPKNEIQERAQKIAKEVDFPEMHDPGTEESAESIAIGSMYQAGQFNAATNRVQKTSMHAQQEKYAVFRNSLESSVEKGSRPLDAGLSKNRKIFYNTRGNTQTMGGVDQHGLGKGRVRRVLSYRSVRLLMPIVGIFIVGVYVFYLNLPNLNFEIAENRSGIDVSQPSYVPEGFNLSGPVKADTGQIKLSFKNGENSYDVSQKKIDWDSSALLANKVLKESAEYSAYTDRGLTIYVYDGKAVWVNQGKVNQIDTKGSSLDTEELIRISCIM